MRGSAIVLAMLYSGVACSCGRGPIDTRTHTDAGLDATLDAGADAGFEPSFDGGFWPRCEATSPCVRPGDASPLEMFGTARLPAAHYRESPDIGCLWVVFRSDATGAVTIETGSRGPGWSLSPPDGAECDATGTDCILRNAADGAHHISGTSCSGSRRCAASGYLSFDLDLAAQLVSLGYGFDTSSCPSGCSACE